jgi:hypothetical protein
MIEKDKDEVALPPEELGFLAAALGCKKEENPFQTDTFEHEAWYWGWGEYLKFKSGK